MEILNLQQIIWQAINFLILYLVIAKFVVPPTQKYLHKRDKEIREGLENAERVKKQLSEAETMKNDIVAAARVEGQKLIEEMRTKAEELSKKLQEEAKLAAHEEARKITEQAEVDLERRRERMDEDAVRIAALIAQKSLSASLDVKLQHELIQKQLHELKSAQVQATS